MRVTPLYSRAISVLVAFLLIVGPCVAQSTSTLDVVVKDPTGTLINKAQVQLIRNGKSQSLVSTNQRGEARFNKVPAGRYQIHVEAPGFNTATIENIQVAVQVTRRADVTLEIGAVADVVTVEGGASVLQTDTPVRQTNVTERQVRELPLQVSSEFSGRTPLSFIFLDSNVTAGASSGT